MKFIKTQDQRLALSLLGAGRNILLYGGSRSGKTFILVYAVLYRALKVPGSRHAILRNHANSVRQAIVNDTLPKVSRLCFPGLEYKLNRSDLYLTLPNRSEIWFSGLEKAERSEKILGREFATLYYNECSEIDYGAVQLAQTRLAQKSDLRLRAFFDCNPPGRRHWTYKLFIEKRDPLTNTPLRFPDHYLCMQMNPGGNRANLPDGYIEERLEGLSFRQRERFLKGEFLADLDGALWSLELIERNRLSLPRRSLDRVVVGVDPAVTGDNDYTGIVVCGRDGDGEYYVLADRSLKGTPLEWSKAVVSAYHEFGADRIIGESNNGGDLIELALRGIDENISYKKVTASRGKLVRAEPVAALYERGKVHHLGVFPELEDQLTSYVPGHFAGSPDRMDALVWAITELLRSSGRGERWITA